MHNILIAKLNLRMGMVKCRKVLEERIKRSAESIATFQKQLQEHQATIQYFESLIPRIEQRAEEPCVICLDPIRSLTLTPCGHLFCNACILTFIRQQNNCPTCRKQVVEGQLFEVKVNPTLVFSISLSFFLNLEL